MFLISNMFENYVGLGVTIFFVQFTMQALFCSRFMINVFFFFLEKDDEARERDQMRYERHKDRARERNLSRAAPDKRY